MIEVRPAEPWEPNHCVECGADIDVETKQVRRPEGLHYISFGDRVTMQLCPRHLVEVGDRLSRTGRGWFDARRRERVARQRPDTNVWVRAFRGRAYHRVVSKMDAMARCGFDPKGWSYTERSKWVWSERTSSVESLDYATLPACPKCRALPDIE